MTISVEDWDELADARRRRDERRAAAPAAPREVAADAVPAPAPAPAPAAAAVPAVERYRPPGTRAVSAPAAPRVAAPHDLPPYRAPEPQPRAEEEEPETTLGVARFADDRYGDTDESLRLPGGIAIANVLIWAIGRVAGVVELVGVAFFVSVGLLLAAYVLREWQRDRTALICLGGAIPLPFTIAGIFF
jgi:hypothetical protein